MFSLADTLIFESDTLTARSISVSDMANNVYLLTNRATGEQVLIDAADDFPDIRRFAEAALAADSPTNTDRAGQASSQSLPPTPTGTTFVPYPMR